MKATYLVLSGIAVLALAGCETIDPSHSYGNAVRELVSQQTVNPGAATAAAPVVEGGDPVVVKATVDNSRERAVGKATRTTHSEYGTSVEEAGRAQ